MQKMYLLLVISTKQDHKEFLDLFERYEVPHVYSVPCTGTAGSGTLALLGLEKTEKIAHFTLATRNKTEELFAALTREVQIDLPQRGIALALPLTSISGAMALRGFAGGHENDEMTKEPYPMQTDKELIVIICENGHTDEVMQAARAAGAGDRSAREGHRHGDRREVLRHFARRGKGNGVHRDARRGKARNHGGRDRKGGAEHPGARRLLLSACLRDGRSAFL